VVLTHRPAVAAHRSLAESCLVSGIQKHAQACTPSAGPQLFRSVAWSVADGGGSARCAARNPAAPVAVYPAWSGDDGADSRSRRKMSSVIDAKLADVDLHAESCCADFHRKGPRL
jgi:hypothetical protein